MYVYNMSIIPTVVSIPSFCCNESVWVKCWLFYVSDISLGSLFPTSLPKYILSILSFFLL